MATPPHPLRASAPGQAAGSASAKPETALSAEGLEVLRHSARGATARLQALLHSVAAGVLFLGREGRVDLVNQALCQMLDVASAGELVGQPAATAARLLSERFADPAAFAAQGFLEGGQRLLLANGRVLSREFLPVGLEGEAHGVLVLLREVSAALGAEELESLPTATLVDELTGLPNRRGFIAQASRRLRRAWREGRGASLLCLDVDGLKTINERLGHTVGDQALQEAAALLQLVFQKGDTVARLGGDEFAVLSLDVAEGQQGELLERLARETSLLNARPGRAWRLSLGVGATAMEGTTPPVVEEMLATADSRLRAQKRARQSLTP